VSRSGLATLVGYLLVMALLFLGALIEATPPPATHVAVIAESAFYADEEPLVVRLSAVDVAAHRPMAATGTVELGDVRVEINGDVARLPRPAKLADGRHSLLLALDLEGRSHVRLQCAIALHSSARPSSELWRPATPPVVPVDHVRQRQVSATVTAASVDGTLHSPTSERLVVELLVDGVLRQVSAIDTSKTARFTLPMPAGVAPDALLIVHAASPWPLDRGVWAVARGIAAEGVEPVNLRPAPLTCDPAHAAPHVWRTAFEAAAVLLLLAVSVPLIWRARRDGGRAGLLLVLAMVALAAVLVGLDAILRLLPAQ
jgi:hypothetical protein